MHKSGLSSHLFLNRKLSLSLSNDLYLKPRTRSIGINLQSFRRNAIQVILKKKNNAK